MFMAFHSNAERKPILIAASLSLIFIGIGFAVPIGTAGGAANAPAK